MEEITFPSEIPEQPEIQELKDYWYALSQASEGDADHQASEGDADHKVPTLPPRSAINPGHLKKYLPDITIMELTEENDFHIRLFGTNLASWMGPDRTGRTLVNITADIETTLELSKAQLRWLNIMNRVIAEKKPLVWTGLRFDITKKHHQIRAISLPLTQTTGDVEQIMTALYLHVPPRSL